MKHHQNYHIMIFTHLPPQHNERPTSPQYTVPPPPPFSSPSSYKPHPAFTPLTSCRASAKPKHIFTRSPRSLPTHRSVSFPRLIRVTRVFSHSTPPPPPTFPSARARARTNGKSYLRRRRFEKRERTILLPTTNKKKRDNKQHIFNRLRCF